MAKGVTDGSYLVSLKEKKDEHKGKKKAPEKNSG